MNVVLTNAAEIALRTLGEEDRRKVFAWVDHLRNWERDTFVRSKSHKLALPQEDNIFVLETTTDLRIFFALHPDRIELTDIARRTSLETVRHAS